jgi:predicted metal-dependent hydrolase
MVFTPPVQPDLPFLSAPTLQSAPERIATIDFVRMRRARRYIVRVQHDGSVRVTIPRGGSRAEAARFVQRQMEWIARQRERVQAAHVTRGWTHGATLMLRGELVSIHVQRTSTGSICVRYGDRSVVGSEDDGIRRCIEADLRALARQEIGGRLYALAAEHNLTVSRFTVRNQRSRWGSCSRAGRIALNFRLVQMPPAVADYVILHELMHLKEQNHSSRFWRLVERVCPDYRDAERWLRVQGPGLL